MVSAFTAGVMWQALSSKDNVVELTAMLMLPYRRREFVFSYVVVLGAYTVFTQGHTEKVLPHIIKGISLGQQPGQGHKQGNEDAEPLKK